MLSYIGGAVVRPLTTRRTSIAVAVGCDARAAVTTGTHFPSGRGNRLTLRATFHSTLNTDPCFPSSHILAIIVVVRRER